MLRFDTPIVQANVAGLVLAHVEIQLAGPRPILRAHFAHVDANGATLPLPPVQLNVVNDTSGNHFDDLFSTDGNADSLRTRLYKALGSKLTGASKATVVADPVAPAPVKAPDVAVVVAAEATPIVAAK